MTAGPLFSVIVPTYGRPLFLAEALESILRQGVGDFEVLVVDDANPTEVNVPADRRIRVIRRHANGGAAASRNTGLEHARGRFIAFLDDDDWYTPNRLQLAIDGLERASITTCWRNWSNGATPRRRVLEGSLADSILDGPTPHLGTTTIDKALAPRFDERFTATEDVEWWLRVAARADVSTVQQVGYVKRRHPTPRHGTDLRSHLTGGLLLMEVHAQYFRTHPTAEVHRLLMTWQHAQSLGEYGIARRAAIQALRLHPHPRAVTRLMRSLRSTVPSTGDRAALVNNHRGGTAA